MARSLHSDHVSRPIVSSGMQGRYVLKGVMLTCGKVTEFPAQQQACKTIAMRGRPACRSAEVMCRVLTIASTCFGSGFILFFRAGFGCRLICLTPSIVVRFPTPRSRALYCHSFQHLQPGCDICTAAHVLGMGLDLRNCV